MNHEKHFEANPMIAHPWEVVFQIHHYIAIYVQYSTYVHVHIHICTCTDAHACAHTHIYTHTRTRADTHTHILMSWIKQL